MTIWQIETAWLDRLRAHLNALHVAAQLTHTPVRFTQGAGYDSDDIVLFGTLDPIDWSNPETAPVLGLQLVFSGIAPGEEVGLAAMLSERWSVDIYIDRGRAQATHLADAASIVTAAIDSITGWEARPGLDASLTTGDPTGFDTRTARISIAFNTPFIANGY